MKCILTVTSGSRAYGCATPTSDHDKTAIILESLESRVVLGAAPFTTQQVKTPEGDTHLYSLETFCKLASQGNPNMVEVLFSPVLQYTEEGNALIELRDAFWSKHAGYRFLGYMQAQKERLLGLRGQKDVTRKELVAKYGYDTKYAYHIIRLGILGRDFINSGYIGLPMRPVDISCLTAIRNGQWKLGEVVAEAEELERQLKCSLEGKAPEHPDLSRINRFMQHTYRHAWCPCAI